MRSPLHSNLKFSWYYAPSFLLFWIALFFAVVRPLFNRLPDTINIAEESHQPGEFVAERAQRLLYSYDRIGPKVVGSIANEVTTVAYLLEAVEQVRLSMRTDLYELEVDVQQPSGAYMFMGMLNMYQGIQNVVVKLSTKSSNSSSYLLLNSHFDSKPGSPGSGDDGTMVVVMLEVLRQMAISETVFQHPVVFLFNGAEENPLQASHGFISQHKWATNCKALINLDVAGSGGRDLLFQSGPNNPWLMKYYQQNAKHPFATTIGEEIFQSGMLPSDSDFRIFRDYGQVPGLDIAQISNGYVYHTVFDNFAAVPAGSVQNTGDNILSLVRAFSNASEMYNTEEHIEGHSIFFDFLGLFLIYYTETTGIILNCCIAVVSLVLVACSLWRMTRVSELSLGQISIRFGLLLALQVVSLVLCFGLPLLMAVLYDAGDRSLTYVSNNWLVIGLYVCPAVIGLVLPQTLYLTLKRSDTFVHSNNLHMILHAQCVILAVITIILTAMGWRSQYLCMISILFYAAALLVNLLSTLHDRGYYWVLMVEVLQLLPFLYCWSLVYTFLVIFFPIMARNGSSVNPDLIIAIVCALGTFLALGFVVPLINMFRWPKLILLSLGVVTFIFCMIAVSEVGFPYRPKTSVMRVHLMHVRRMFYEHNGSMSVNDSGYYFDYQDRRTYLPLENTSLNLTGLRGVNSDCDNYVMCGVPCFWYRSCNTRTRAGWLPREEPMSVPALLNLQLLGKSLLKGGKTMRYEFELTGPPHMNLFLQPLEGVSVVDWSFLRNMLDEPQTYSAPYLIYFSYGKDNTPLNFYMDFTKADDDFEAPVFELGVVGYYVSYDFDRDPLALQFINNFPDFVHVMEWPAFFQRFVF